jgi:hypothetical protein
MCYFMVIQLSRFHGDYCLNEGHYLGFWHSVVKVCIITVEEHTAFVFRVNELGSG